MKAIVAHLFLLVFVTNVPGGTTQRINTRPVDTSKIIRFFGSSFIKYDLIQLPSEVRRSVNKESMHLSFYTRSSNGLMWLYIGPDNEKVHISVRDGALLFVMDDGRRLPQQVVVQDPQSRSLMNRWVKVRVEKEGKTLKFYLDDQYVTQVTANGNINLLGGGVVYMGGVLQPSVQTGGVISENYNGFLAHVESRKLPAPSREMITNFLQFADTAVRTGDVEFLDREYWESRKWSWEEVTTPVPERATPITFKSASSVLVIRDDLDMRRSGSFSFRFRTLEPRGLLAMASGNSQTVQANFIAIEIFDGILYMVYEVGTASSRKQVSNRRVDDGEWHDVVLKVDGNQLIVSLDEQQVPTTLQQADTLRMYFFNLYIGGFEDFKRVPWALYSRQGYRGCLEALKVNNIGADLHNFDSKVVGIEVGCRTMTRFCQRQPCVSGFCRDRMDSYVCDCANTPFTGQDCDANAVIASWDGTKSTNFEFLNRDVTHTNDISFRFLTPLRNTLLFKTEVANSDDYIQGELVEGRVKVTMSVGGQTKTFFTGENLNDYFWHTLYIRRRADDIEIQVDNLPKRVGILGGNNFNLKIDRIKFGSLNSTGGTNSFSSNNYIGYMQNFIYGDQELFNQLKKLNSNVKWYLNVSPDNLPLITYKPVTVTTSNTYFQLPPLKMGITMKILFKFKTRESNGLLLYNGGTGKDVIAIELSNGLLRLAYNLGGRNMFSVVQTKTPLNDNEWHTVRVSLDERGQFSLRVDDENLVLSTSDGNQRLELSGALYIAGMPEAMFRKPEVTGLIESRKGFRGCIASMDLNGAVPDLVRFSPEKHLILDRCTDLEMTCKPNACGPGVCVPGVDDYRCDCDMTGYVGRPCNDYPVGYYFGRNGANGMVIYQYPFEKQADSDMDQIAFGFMTEREDGVLYRVQSSLGSDEFIEIRLENGFVIAESNTGGGIIYLAERSKMFNDGKYHVVRYIRTSTNSTLQVDQMPFQSATHTGGASVFNKVYTVMMGGRTDSNGAQIMNFNGIMGGAYYNGHRWFDVLSGGRTIHGKSVETKGDVVLAKPYILVKGGGVKPTIAPPDVYIPPNSEIPGDLGGGGIIIGPEIGGANGGGGPDVIGIGGAGGVTGLIGGAGINVPGEPVPLASAMVGPAPPPLATGARAGAVVGTVLGTLAFMSSLMWALYKLKPGVPTCLSPGAGSAGAGAGGGGMSISQPRATSNLGAVQAASAGGGGAGGGAGAGAGKVTVVNGSAAGGGAGAGGGGGGSTYTSYFQSTSTSVGGAGAGGAGAGGAGGAGAGGAGTDQFDSATLRATGTFSNKGTAIGTPGASRAALGSSSAAYSSNYQSNTMQSYGSGQGSPPAGTLGGVSYERNYMASNDGIPDYDLPVSGTMQSGNSYSSSTLNTHYNYQVQNQRTVAMNRQGQYVLTSSGFSGAVTPGAAADEVRVDCCLMTADGRSVVTGSSIGPPQAWDMQNGELQTIMKGDTVGSTNLHLVCGDRLLVGAVHADMEINEYSGRKGVFNHTLQIWDFQTGKPLSMAEGEYCSAMCPMSDSDKVLFARTDKFGDATSIIAWDLMGNQMIKEMRYDAPVGNNDYVSYLNKSKNDRYVVAGFTNSFDNCAEFMVFDMNLTSYNINEPAMLKLDASPECTAILPKDEAVTGLRNGDLVIWSIRTGQPSRQLLGSGGAHAHSREVKSVTLSEDGKYLVSASADGTLKVWDMNTERPIHTLSGHSDEVCCSAISADNEIVVSGSSDGTIRLWRMKNGTEMCVFNCGIDIFFVTMSHDKGTIVALADKLGARKLIMLQVVRTKIKKIVSS